MITHKQLELADIYEGCKKIFEEDKPKFLSLMEQHINISEYISPFFYSHYHALTGRKRGYPLVAFIWALLIQKILSIPTDQLLLVFLKFSRPLREFCGFTKVPDASKITRFKQDFVMDLQAVFDKLVDVTEPICRAIDAEKADMAIFDTSGIEAWVKENNPKFANKIIKQLKSYAKSKNFGKSFDPYKAAYASMPTSAAIDPEIKQMHINGHFCYAYKFGLVVNGLNIIRHIAFYNKDFLKSHPELLVEKKSDSPDEDKSVGDARLLIPTLKDYFKAHPLIDPKTFIGDSAFDAVHIFKELLTGDTFGENRHFQKAYIPLNPRSQLENFDYTINEDGIPCCPGDPSKPMRPEGKAPLKGGVQRFKFVCPKIKWVKNGNGKYQRVTQCADPCTSSKSGRMVYLYPEKDLRAIPGAVRGTEEWDSTYKIRGGVEKAINHFKDCFCLAGRKTNNDKTLHADLLLAGIAQLITVVVADKIGRHDLIRSLKPLAS
jgi:hypothetical protein